MKTKVRLFAMLREKAGMPEFALELPEASTVADLRAEMTRRFPGLPVSAPTTMVAVNAEYAEETHLLHDGDEVALIPPVSGGAGWWGTYTPQPSGCGMMPPHIWGGTASLLLKERIS